MLEEGIVTESEQGSPQGATISPLLANASSDGWWSRRPGHQGAAFCRRDYESLKSKGIVFVRDPKDQPYGTVAVFAGGRVQRSLRQSMGPPSAEAIAIKYRWCRIDDGNLAIPGLDPGHHRAPANHSVDVGLAEGVAGQCPGLSSSCSE